MKAKRLSLNILFLFYFFYQPVFPQQSDLSKTVNYLSEFIASDQFLKLKITNNDLALVDSIYFRALEFVDYNIDEALLALTFASIPYREVPIVIPIVNVNVYYPLISADERTSNLKNQNLPSELFFDTPENSYGDKDKIAHFFGNTFLSYSEDLLDLADVFGYFVETFEEDFKAQSQVDYRDIDVNWYGKLFGNLLEENKKILPSQVMTIRSLRYFTLTL